MGNFDGKAAGAENIRQLWNLLASLVKKLTGDVDLTQGDLQTQISNSKTKLDNTNVGYGTCSTQASTAAKVIAISGNTNWKLAVGSEIVVKFTYTNTASNPTFNVNGSGAKSVWYNTALITTSNLGYAGTANRPMKFVYDGTQYVFIGWSYDTDTNTTYSNASLGQGYGTCSTAAATVAKVVSLSSYSLTTGGVVSVKFTYAVPASATMNINSKGAKAIYYKGSAITAGIINAGDVATFIYNGSQYILLTVDSYQTKIDALDKAINDALALRASLGAYGLVKVTDSAAVTDSTGLALAATEKNASISGTLANQISQLNTDFYINYIEGQVYTTNESTTDEDIKIFINSCLNQSVYGIAHARIHDDYVQFFGETGNWFLIILAQDSYTKVIFAINHWTNTSKIITASGDEYVLKTIFTQ